MPSLTSLPLSLLSRILSHLRDIDTVVARIRLHGTVYCLPYRYPPEQISLDGAHTARPHFPELLAPALASPVLAAAATEVLEQITYLTDTNTEGRLPEWVKAFSTYVRAVSISDFSELWKDTLPKHTRRTMARRLCCDAVDLFREITLNDVRLEVLDLVHVPFDKCGDMRDAMMTGLCTTLESCQSTLRELALPVYVKSHLCTHALQIVTLPHLTVCSIELKDKHNYGDSFSRDSAVGAVFLRMMKAVDRHADRSTGLTTLRELRLMNLYDVPCTNARDSGCSAGFFRAIKTLRVSGSDSTTCNTSRELRFFCLFEKLKVLFWTGVPGDNPKDFENFCKNLKEVHLCHLRWIKRVQLGAEKHPNWVEYPYHISNIWENMQTNLKIKTLAVESLLLSSDLRGMWSGCPNVENLSLYVTRENVYELGELIQNCKMLRCLEIIISEKEFGRLGADGWQEIGNAIPRRHDNLFEIAIQTRQRGVGEVVPLDAVFKCISTVVKRMGARAERLWFRGLGKSKTVVRDINAIRSIIDSCRKRMFLLERLQIELTIRNNAIAIEDLQEYLQASRNLQLSYTELIKSQFWLEKLEVKISFMNK